MSPILFLFKYRSSDTGIWYFKVYFLLCPRVLWTKLVQESWYTISFTEWQHRQCVGLVFQTLHVRSSLSAVSLVICSPARIAVCNMWSSGSTALCRVGGATRQLDLPSLTPLSIAGCGWLQRGAPHWATSVNYCK